MYTRVRAPRPARFFFIHHPAVQGGKSGRVYQNSPPAV